jgi:hypothetical protein
MAKVEGGAYVDAAVDAGTTLGALLNRIRVLEGTSPPDVARGVRGVREVLEFTILDWESRFRVFEGELERLRPAGGEPIHGR